MPALPSVVSALQHRFGNAAQDMNFLPRQLRPVGQLVQPWHQLLGCRRIQKTHVNQRRLPMLEHALDRNSIGQWRLRGTTWRRESAKRHPPLIGNELYRCTQIERAKSWVGRDAQGHMTLVHILVSHAKPLGTEQQAHRMGLPRNRLKMKARRDGRRTEVAWRHGSSTKVIDTVKRFLKRVNNARLGQNIQRPTGPLDRLFTPQHIGPARRHQHHIVKTHDLHGPRCSTDIAGMAGIDQNKTGLHRGVKFIHCHHPHRRTGISKFFTPFMSSNLHPMLNVAIKAARSAGAIINRAALDVESVRISQKQINDFVTEVDKASEDAIIEMLLTAYPGHGILAEESGSQHGAKDSEFVWIIDPLDGTTNFIHGFPVYAVSIALAVRGKVEQAVVFDPSRNDLFTASKGRGAFMNDRRIRVSKRIRLADCLISTGFPFRPGDNFGNYMGMMADIMPRVAGLRRPGAAALDLAYVAAGFTDGFFEAGLSPWDVAAGSLLITEAGGLVGNFTGEANFLDQQECLAANPKVYGQLVPLFGKYSKFASAGEKASLRQGTVSVGGLTDVPADVPVDADAKPEHPSLTSQPPF